MLAALSAATVWTVVAVAIDDTGRDGDVGLAQRAQLLAVAAWLILTPPSGRRIVARLTPHGEFFVERQELITP